MADRRRPAEGLETDRQFLDRNNVNWQIKEVLTKVLENRPDDPIAFLADYFDTVGEKTNLVNRAHQQLLLTHHSRPAYANNVRIAYDMLSHNKVNVRSGRHPRGLSGSLYEELLNKLCSGFPERVKERLLKKISCRRHEVVVFDIFRSGVFTCFVLQDYMKQAASLYATVDVSGTGKVDRALCDSISQELHNAVSNTTQHPTSILEAGYALGPDRLYMALSKALMTTGGPKGTTTCDDFTAVLVDAFLSKVHSLR